MFLTTIFEAVLFYIRSYYLIPYIKLTLLSVYQYKEDIDYGSKWSCAESPF